MPHRRKFRIAVVIAMALAFLSACERKQLERHGTADASGTRAVLSLPLPAVSDAVRRTFNSWQEFIAPQPRGEPGHRRRTDKPWGEFFLFEKGDQQHLFPEDSDITLDSYPDPQLRDYVAIPQELRKNDFYLYEPTGD